MMVRITMAAEVTPVEKINREEMKIDYRRS